MKKALFKNRKRLSWQLILVSGIILSFSSCDIIDEPFIKETNQQNDTTLEFQKKVLLEEFTGHKCGNCPRAHERAHLLKEMHGESLVLVSVHAGFFAMPIGNYTADYRTEAGNALDEYYGNSLAGLPNGLINRKAFNSNYPQAYSAWAQAIEDEMSLEAEAGIVIENNLINSSLETRVSIHFLKTIEEDLSVTAYLFEDSILSLQTDYQQTPTDIENYLHRNVLRKNISDIWGEKLEKTSVYERNTVMQLNWETELSDEWDLNNCGIVCFISNMGTKEIIQVEQCKLSNK